MYKSSRLISRHLSRYTRYIMSSPIPSPPHKRVKTDTVLTGSMTEITEAPVNALFVPPPPASTSAAAVQAGPSTNKNPQISGKGGKRRKQRRELPDPYSAGEVLWYDIQDFLGKSHVDRVLEKKDGDEWSQPEGLELQSIVELRVGAFTVSGKSGKQRRPREARRRAYT